MDDLARRLESGSGRILLYGDPGIGKTRLLEELRDSRLAGKRVHWVDLGAIDAGGKASQGGEAEIAALFENASPGDYLIADHFERGRRDQREQLIRSWAGVGRAKGLKMIVASRYYLFNELRRLSHQYHVRVQSIQQMSLNDDEVMAFLYSRLFAANPTGRLGMPMPVRKQIVDARGNLRRVLDIAAREAAQFEALPPVPDKLMRQAGCRIAILLTLLALTGVLGWQLLNGREEQADEDAFADSGGARPVALGAASLPSLPATDHAAIAMPMQRRLERRLQQSIAWIDGRDARTGIIEILVADSEAFDPERFFGYVAKLDERHADSSALRVFPTRSDGVAAYSVVYGEYESRQLAKRAIAELATVFRDAEPRARTLGGLSAEIRRLDDKN